MKSIYQAVMLFVLMTVLCGIVYPAVITGIGQWVFYEQSQGSLVKVNEKIVGSKLVAQSFTQQKYFWPRPSASAHDAVPSKASNLGPTSQELLLKIKQRRLAWSRAHNVDEKSIPPDLLTASASGLDPHISLDGAHLQVARIAQARGMGEGVLKDLIAGQAEGTKFAIFGEKRVNVLMLNQSLDAWSTP